MMKKYKLLPLAAALTVLLSSCAMPTVQHDLKPEAKETVVLDKPAEATIVEEQPQEKEAPEESEPAISSTEYADSEHRFTVTMPDVFTLSPEEAQPTDGAYMQTEDGSAYISITVEDEASKTNEELAEKLDESFGILAAIRPDGLVVYSGRFTDGFNDSWAYYDYYRLFDGFAVHVEYVFRTDMMDTYKSGCDITNIM